MSAKNKEKHNKCLKERKKCYAHTLIILNSKYKRKTGSI